MESNEKVIQSYLPHAFLFEEREALKRSGEHKEILLIPAQSAKRNIVITNDETIARLSDDPTFKAILDAKLIRILDAIPAKYQDQTETLIQARTKLADTQNERDAARAENRSLLDENEQLKKRIEELEAGSKVKSYTAEEIKAAAEAARSAKK